MSDEWKPTPDAWQGLVYVPDGSVKRGIVTRASGAGPWKAGLYVCAGMKLIGEDFATSADAQRAVEVACEPPK